MAAKNVNREEWNELIKGSKPVLVDFWAPWCSYCRRIGPAYDKIAQQYENLEVVKVNIDEVPGLGDAYRVEYIPTLILLDAGLELGRVTAPESKAAIDRFIAENLGE